MSDSRLIGRFSRAQTTSEISPVHECQMRIAILVNEFTTKLANNAEIPISCVLYPVSEAMAASNSQAKCKVCKAFPLDALVPNLPARPTDDPIERRQMLRCRSSARLRLDET